MKTKVRDLKNKIRAMTGLELQDKLREAKEELFNLRFQLAAGHLDDYSRLRQLRSQIARIQTVVRERELGIR